MPARTYLVSAAPARGYKPSQLELLVKSLSSEHNAEVARKESFPRGSVVNFQEKAEVVMASKFDPESEPDFDFYTGITIVDFTGGESMDRRNRSLVTPSRAVMMDPSGKLFLQSELDDHETVAEFESILDGP